MHPELNLEFKQDYWIGRFRAMASPCEILIETDKREDALKLTAIAAKEAWRIEQKFSRYRKDNIISEINTSNGSAIEVDEETTRLLNFSDQCYQISDGLFDITSGILRKVWTFDGSNIIPGQNQIDKLLESIGWDKTCWEPPLFTLPAGMEIDLGGIGKEYAVDQVIQLLSSKYDYSILVNFGGDLHANKPRSNNRPWLSGIENPDNTTQAAQAIEIYKGALATSGDVKRFIINNGKRYSHILNPKTGWPVSNAPHSVTVAAATCTEAGILATLASLQGAEAEEFLKAQQLKFWCMR